jgi:hypothetical protein
MRPFMAVWANPDHLARIIRPVVREARGVVRLKKRPAVFATERSRSAAALTTPSGPFKNILANFGRSAPVDRRTGLGRHSPARRSQSFIQIDLAPPGARRVRYSAVENLGQPLRDAWRVSLTNIAGRRPLLGCNPKRFVVRLNELCQGKGQIGERERHCRASRSITVAASIGARSRRSGLPLDQDPERSPLAQDQGLHPPGVQAHTVLAEGNTPSIRVMLREIGNRRCRKLAIALLRVRRRRFKNGINHPANGGRIRSCPGNWSGHCRLTVEL